MSTPNFQGFPKTVQRGDTVEVTLRWRTPLRVKLRSTLFKLGVIASLGGAVYGLVWGGLDRYDPLLLAGMFFVWLAVLGVGLSAATWRTRVIVFTAERIIFSYKTERKKLNRRLSHGFRIVPFHFPVQGQPPHQQGAFAPLLGQEFYLYLDHSEQTVLLGQIHGARLAQMIHTRLVNVSEYMKQRYAHQGEVHRGEASQRGTFTRRVAI